MSVVVGLRANAGPSIGFGHVRRCLSLAQALRERRSEIVFLVNPESAPEQWIPRDGAIHVETVPAQEARTLEHTSRVAAQRGIDALVVDSYDTGEEALGTLSVPTAVLIDAPPVRALPVRLVVNSSADAPSHPHLLAPGARALLGLDFVLLRPGLVSASPRSIKNHVEGVLVIAGAGDESGISPVVTAASRRALPAARVTVLVGPYFPDRVLETLAAQSSSDDHVTLVRSPETMKGLMLDADLAISAGGQTLYELAATGTPACAVRVAANQTGNLVGLAAKGSIEWVADADDPNLSDRVESALRRLGADDRAREGMSRAGRVAVDGLGASRVADEVLDLCR